MSRRLSLLAIAVALVAGCAPSRIPVSELSGFEELNQRARGKTVQIVLVSGTVMHARNVHVSADSLAWTERWSGEMASGRWTGEEGSVPTADVKAVKIHRTGRGILKDLLHGGGIGLAVSGPTYLMNPDEPYREVVFAVLPVLGALIGIPVGMITDHDVYEFAAPPETERDSRRRH